MLAHEAAAAGPEITVCWHVKEGDLNRLPRPNWPLKCAMRDDLVDVAGLQAMYDQGWRMIQVVYAPTDTTPYRVYLERR